MSIIKMLLKEMEQEAQSTRKMLSRIPDDKYDWQPHPKSMTIRTLATHIAELPDWILFTLNSHELDFAKHPYDPLVINSTEKLMETFEKSLSNGMEALSTTTEPELEKNWVLRNGDDIYMSLTKGESIRQAFCQIVHHRAQLGVFLRLLNIPIPGSYGPSADEM